MAGYLSQNKGNRSNTRFGSAASRRLRSAGYNISPAARRHRHDGIFVAGRGDYISVLVDLPGTDRCARAAEEIAATVRSWGMTPEVTVSKDSCAWVRFPYRVAPAPVVEAAPPAPAQEHDADTCCDLECVMCCPEYIPTVGDRLQDVLGNVWVVTSTSTPRGGHIQLRHTVHGHYADHPRKENGAFRRSTFTRVDAPAA